MEQDKKTRIRHLYDEIDNLDCNYAKAKDKNERTRIRKVLFALREEVAGLLEPQKQENVSQILLKRESRAREDERYIVFNTGEPSHEEQTVSAPVVQDFLTHCPRRKVEREAHSYEPKKQQKQSVRQTRTSEGGRPQKTLGDLKKRIRKLDVRIQAELARRERLSGTEKSSDVTLQQLISSRFTLQLQQQEARVASRKAKKKQQRNKLNKKREIPNTSPYVPEKKITHIETEEEARVRRQANAANLKTFRSSGCMEGYFTESISKRRFWFNEED